MRESVEQRVHLERETPLGSESVGAAHDALVQHINAVLDNHSARLLAELEQDATRALGSLSETFRHMHQTAIQGLREQVLREADIIRQERGLGTTSGERAHITVNINQSQVGALNLGQVIGDIDARVATLNDSGYKELAQALKALTETINAHAERQVKEESLEVLDELAREFTQEKKPSRLRAFGSRILQLTHDPAIVAAYEVVRR